MTNLAMHFVDPTIPGISGRDLLQHAGSLARTGCSKAVEALRGVRRELAVQHALADLDRNMLRDIGVDRDAM